MSLYERVVAVRVGRSGGRAPDRLMDASPLFWLSTFAAVYAFFVAAPAVFHGAFPLYSNIEWGDALDVLTPFVVFGVLWMALRSGAGPLDPVLLFAFVALALVWTQGQGMHLSSNSIEHQVPDGASGPLPNVIHFYDEQLSHYIHQSADMLLPLFLLAVVWRGQGAVRSARGWMVVLPAALYGTVVAVSSIEANVIPLALPVMAGTGLVVGVAYQARPRLRESSLFAFSGVAVVVALGVLVGWGAYHGGWPELSEVGLI